MKALVITSIILSLSTPLFAAKKSSGVKLTSTRSKYLDMEGAVVESMNKRPLDSLNTLADDAGANRTHLYSKPKHFQPENRRTLERARYQ